MLFHGFVSKCNLMNKDIKFMKIAPLGILTISENKKLNSKAVKKHP